MRPRREIADRDIKRLESLARENLDKAQLQRVQCVLLRAQQGMTCDAVAAVVGWHPGWVRQVWSAFLRDGAQALVSKARGGRRRSNLSLDRERELVERFETHARHGGVLEISRIREAYEQAAGHGVPASTIYRLLARHGWRKVVPRPRHPKNDPAAGEEFKKNSRRSSRASAGGKRPKV